MFRMRNKLRGGPERIDLVSQESNQSGGSAEVEGLRDEADKGMTEIPKNAENMQARQVADDADGVKTMQPHQVWRVMVTQRALMSRMGIMGRMEKALGPDEDESEDCEGGEDRDEEEIAGVQDEYSSEQVASVKRTTPLAFGKSVQHSHERSSQRIKRGRERLQVRKKGRTGKKKLADIKAPYGSLKTRSTPHVLMNAIERMNDDQRAAVERIGFGSVLKLDIWELPSRLGLWVVSNYDARSSCLKLPDNTKMHITAEDVNTVLGWPIGGERIQNNKRNKDKLLVNEWRLKIDTTGIKITPHDVVEKMLQCTDGGEWFVRHFVTLIMSVLVDSTSHGYVNALVMDHLRAVGRVPKLNWCQYVLDKLIENKLRWEKKKKQLFGGPVLFLMVFYVDRVSDFSRTVPRTYPAVLAWSGKELRKRENNEAVEGGFGLGHDEGRMSREMREEVNRELIERERKATEERDITEHENVIIEDSKESSPELLAAVDEAEKEAEMRKKYEEFINDVPSFSLGMTQVLEEEGGMTHEMQKSSEVNEEMTPANISHADPHNTPNMAGPMDTGNIELEQNKDIEQSEGMIGAECDAVQNNEDLNNEMEETNEERRDERGGGLKREFDEDVQYARNERARRKTKKSLTLKSPYLTRVIDPRDNVNTFEKNLWKWVVRKHDADRDSTAVFDYGVITMRHMETYTGQALKQWECGLKKGDERAVNALRTKYCAAIVESDINEVKDKIRQLVKHSSG
ncbi:unnamed protein product [Cuscuta campestris]|uniref:Uncharacterized protein n=1 Tax=Cuscuta campestris TaxID=132261 RepID=A0A484LND4_9ASTE|nr:unnamed protein product [Cuscuta campestris]